MVELAVADDERFAASRIELDREGPSYTADTLEAAARASRPEDELFLILGGDQAAALRDLARAREGARARDAWPCSSGRAGAATRSGSGSGGCRGARARALPRHAADPGVVAVDPAPGA